MLRIPGDVQRLIHCIFADCNARVSGKLSRIGNTHETSLDLSFIEHFTHHCRPVQTPSDWTVRLDCHFIGGGRHYMRWEVADFGILVVFRHQGRVWRSKVALFQSKRLYPNEAPNVETNPLDKSLGFNDLFMNDDRWSELSKPRIFTFSERSLYRALEIGDEQYIAIEKYEQRHKIPVHYLLYNPLQIPTSVSYPIVNEPSDDSPCEVGCRIVPSKVMREMIATRTTERPPSFAEISNMLPQPFTEGENVSGWRIEHYVSNLLITCLDGLVDETEKYDHLTHIFSQKAQPIHSAIVITLDMPAIPT